MNEVHVYTCIVCLSAVCPCIIQRSHSDYTHTLAFLVGEGEGGESWEGVVCAAIPVLHRHPERQAKQRYALGEREIRIVVHWEPCSGGEREREGEGGRGE